jgi:hypothetical protein
MGKNAFVDPHADTEINNQRDSTAILTPSSKNRRNDNPEPEHQKCIEKCNTSRQKLLPYKKYNSLTAQPR